jgi:hypothetical protein
MKTSRNALFVDSTDSIIEKMAVMTRIPTETLEKVSLKRCFGTLLSFLISNVALQTRSHNYCDGTNISISRMPE